MLKPLLRLVALVAFVLAALPIGLLAQAAAEYALQSGSRALTNIASSGIAGCDVDSRLLVCLSHSYPRTAILVVGVLCLFAVRWVVRVTSYGAR
jgi:hypothetical protein